MKILLPTILLVIIAILACSLIYEVHQKNEIRDSLAKNLAKEWRQSVITDCVQNYQDLDHGDIEKVKVDLMMVANLNAESYVKSYGHETGTKFAQSLSQAFAIYDVYQATNRPAK